MNWKIPGREEPTNNFMAQPRRIQNKGIINNKNLYKNKRKFRAIDYERALTSPILAKSLRVGLELNLKDAVNHKQCLRK